MISRNLATLDLWDVAGWPDYTGHLEGKQISEDSINGSRADANTSRAPGDTVAQYHERQVPPDPPPSTLHSCSQCEDSFALEALMAFRDQRLCAACKQDFLQHLAQGTLKSEGPDEGLMKKRVLAKVIEFNVVLALYMSIVSTDMLVVNYPAFGALVFGVLIVIYLVSTYMVTVRCGASPGKLIMKLEVVGPDGHPIDAGLSRARAIVELVGLTLFGVGYVTMLIDPKGRALHDILCQTRVQTKAVS